MLRCHCCCSCCSRRCHRRKRCDRRCPKHQQAQYIARKTANHCEQVFAAHPVGRHTRCRSVLDCARPLAKQRGTSPWLHPPAAQASCRPSLAPPPCLVTAPPPPRCAIVSLLVFLSASNCSPLPVSETRPGLSLGTCGRGGRARLLVAQLATGEARPLIAAQGHNCLPGSCRAEVSARGGGAAPAL